MNYDVSPRRRIGLTPYPITGRASEIEWLLRQVRTLVDVVRSGYRQIALITLVCIVGAGLLKVLVGNTYTARAIVQPYLASPDPSVKPGGSVAALDAGFLVDGQMQLLQSHAVARRAVRQLGLDKQAPKSMVRSAAQSLLGVGGAGASPLDRATETLMDRLQVMRQRPSYLIQLSYPASSAEEAARVVNTVAREFIQMQRYQIRAKRAQMAHATLAELQRKYGDRNPLVQRAKEDVDLAQEELKAVESAESADDEPATATLLVAAEAISLPSSAGLRTYLLFGLLIGSGLGVLWLLLGHRLPRFGKG